MDFIIPTSKEKIDQLETQVEILKSSSQKIQNEKRVLIWLGLIGWILALAFYLALIIQYANFA